jgi:putative transposase
MSQRDILAMTQSTRWCRSLIRFACMLFTFVCDAWRVLLLCLRPRAALAAENLFLRKQLALYQERHVKPRRATNVTRLALVWLARWFDWRHALAVVQPETFTRWHRQGSRLFWRWKSRPGRPTIPPELQTLIRQMTRENPTWGQERLANELLVKLGLRVSSRTVRKYMPRRTDRGPGYRVQSQRWSTFVRNHAQAIVACDFCVAMTVTFRILYVLVIIELARRRLPHVNVTAHPTAAWTAQQVVDAFPWDEAPRYLLRDRDRVYGASFRQRVHNMGIEEVLIAPKSPWQNPYVERFIGSIRREGLDHVIVLHVRHLRRLLIEYFQYYHHWRTHRALGMDCPVPRPLQRSEVGSIRKVPEVGGLHHHYERRVA